MLNGANELRIICIFAKLRSLKHLVFFCDMPRSGRIGGYLCLKKDMARLDERLKLWLESYSDEAGSAKSASPDRPSAPMDVRFTSIIRRVLPILILALAINLGIIFTLPIDATMGRWFWLKDPLSIALAYLMIKTFIVIHRFCSCESIKL